MEFVFLGTSAGEQYPAFWCRCETCEKARRLGGKNIRKNSCAWIAPDTLIDFPSEIFMQAERYGIQIVDAQYLLFTHSHEDHFYPYLFGWRHMPSATPLPPPQTITSARFSELKLLRIYGNEQVCAGISEYVRSDIEEHAMQVNQVLR